MFIIHTFEIPTFRISPALVNYHAWVSQPRAIWDSSKKEKREKKWKVRVASEITIVLWIGP